MKYQDWEMTVPAVLREDSLWKMAAYRLALFANHIGWADVTKLVSDRRTRSLSDQLYRSLGSVSANLAEGYSRGTPRDRAHFYEYALGSARESRDWYFKSTPILGEVVTIHRMNLLTDVIRLLLVSVPTQRGRVLKEDTIPYIVAEDTESYTELPTDFQENPHPLTDLQQDVPES